MKNLFVKEIVKKILIVTLCLLVAWLSIFVIAKRAADPQCYKNTIQSIEEKKETVMLITTTAVTASTALASIPGDVTTPIANEIMDTSSYLLIVVCALVLEKSLLTVLGYLAFNILVPGACVLFAVSIFVRKNVLKVLSLKILVFAFVLATIIPFSLKISDLIYETNRKMVTELTSDVGEMEDSEQTNEEKSWWSELKDKVQAGVANAGEKAKQLMNDFIDVIALFIITYCAIPVIIFLVVIWFVKFLFNITIPVPSKESLQMSKILKKAKCAKEEMLEE